MRQCITLILLFALGPMAVMASPRRFTLKRHSVSSDHARETEASKTIRVGSLILAKCHNSPGYCGTLARPFDPAGEVHGNINIGFEYYPSRDPAQSSLGTIVATEGGPGYATTGSRDGYLALFSPLLNRRNLLLVDNRGTGTSQAMDCQPLQIEPHPLLSGVEQCGDSLGATSDLYGSGLAADDLAAVLDALGIEAVDLYGDSYGTFFSQVFTGLHPERLRSLILDSAYPVIGQSPWYPEMAPAMRKAFELSCHRSVTCSALPGDTLTRIQELLEALRAQPVTGKAYDGDGNLVTVTADATGLAFLVFGNSSGPVVNRELDAAARAYLNAEDSAPLLRLIAENALAGLAGGTSNDPKYFSQGLFVAVSCSDYPQIYDMTSQPSARIAQRNAALAREASNHPDVYLPFTIDEFSDMPLDNSILDLCLPWPVPSLAHPPAQPVPPDAEFTSAPTLVLSGDLDSLTPAAQGTQAAALFPNAQQIIVANSFHVTAVGDQDNCASAIVVNFITSLDPGDTSCASRIAEVREVPVFAKTAEEVPPATAEQANRGTQADLRVAAAAALTVADAIARWWVNSSGSGVGRRGGTFSYSSNGNQNTFALHNLRWVEDVSVSGTLDWNYLAPGVTVAHVSLRGAGTESGNLTIRWQDRTSHAVATISGTIGGRKIVATMPAP